MAFYRYRSLLVALVAGVAGMIGMSLAYLFLGFATHVIAMCGGAPAWWATIYFILAFTIPVAGIWLGSTARKRYLWRRGIDA